MVYRAIGLMSGSSLDGLDIAFAEFTEQGGHWSFEIQAAECMPYTAEWKERLLGATTLDARAYLLLHSDYGNYTGQQVNAFIEKYKLHYKTAVIGSHGHTTFHMPERNMTAQLGDGAAIAAQTQLPVVSDLRALDIAFGGQGAPIVPIGEKMLLGDYSFFLNLGGIANISLNQDNYIAFDFCPANRVLNMLAAKEGKEYDAGGQLAAAGTVHAALLEELNRQTYYNLPWPKSLANDYGTDTIFPIVEKAGLSTADALATYTEHIAEQLAGSVWQLIRKYPVKEGARLLATGGGALNDFLMERIQAHLQPAGVTVVKPDEKLIQYKEALIMAFIAVLRWRQEYTVISSVTGASRNSIGGALWIGQEA